MPFSGHNLPDLEALDIGTETDNFAYKFMSDDHRHGNGLLGPIVPMPDMHVRAANRGSPHANECVIDSGNRLFHLLEPQARARMGFDERFHGRILLAYRNMCNMMEMIIIQEYFHYVGQCDQS